MHVLIKSFSKSVCSFGNLCTKILSNQNLRRLSKFPVNTKVRIPAIQKKYFSSTQKKSLKFIQFEYINEPNGVRVGCVTKCKSAVVDLNYQDPCIPNTMLGILQEGVIDRVLSVLDNEPPLVPLCNINMLPPIHGVDKILGVGLNYRDHCKTHKIKIPEVPMIFCKFSSTIIGPCDYLRIRTDVAEKVDWEVELCIVISKVASCVKAYDAYEYVFGCTVAQDISARDWQKKENAGQFLLGKSMDTFCPIGPWIVTSDEIENYDNLGISCCVNGKVKQDSNTSEFIFKIPELIERITKVMTLYPGDLILTGTPAGVGVYQDPQEFLKPSDVLVSWVEHIGCLYTYVDKYHDPDAPEKIPKILAQEKLIIDCFK